MTTTTLHRDAPMRETPAIEIVGLTKCYGARVALNNVHLTIPPGVTGLLGPNGSGKSTMIKTLLGLLSFNAGTISVLGYKVPSEIRQLRDRVGFMPEDDCFIAGLTGIESLAFMAKLSGLPSVEALRRSHEILDFSDIGGERYRAVETYSTGMRQKLKFAQALVHDPELLIFDEPTSGLDPLQREGMLRRIRSLAKNHGKSVLLCTHILHDIREICENVVILSRGTVRVMESLAKLSQPAEPGLQIHVRDRRQVLAESLTQKGLCVQSREDGSLWVIGPDRDIASMIWNAASENDITITRMQPAVHSLEQIFFDAVKDTGHAVA